MFVGLRVTQHSATEIYGAAGRLWEGVTGLRYAKAEAETISLFSYLPVADQKYLNVSVIGQEVDDLQEPRDYLVDLTSGQTEPKAVYMAKVRNVAILITAGLESSTPQRPDAPTGYLTVAHVLLGTSGILEIEEASNKQLMRLFEVWQQTLANLSWINEAAPKLASILSDLANLAAMIRALQAAASADGLVSQLAAEVALIRDKLELPAVYTEYEADNFLVLDESDITNPEYHALVNMGVRFPWAGETEQQLALFNPYDTNVKDHDGLILPAYTEVARLALTGYAGACPCRNTSSRPWRRGNARGPAAASNTARRGGTAPTASISRPPAPRKSLNKYLRVRSRPAWTWGTPNTARRRSSGARRAICATKHATCGCTRGRRPIRSSTA
jgi:hypothetical protein